jgi:hypothetical protein
MRESASWSYIPILWDRAMDKNNRMLWLGLGAGFLFIGFLFVARCTLPPEFMWNALNGSVVGIPYRYILIVVLLYSLFGGSLYGRKQH